MKCLEPLKIIYDTPVPALPQSKYGNGYS